MNNGYKEMLRLFLRDGEVITATEISPDCGRKYLYDGGFTEPALGNGLPEHFPQLVVAGEKSLFFERMAGEPELILVGGGHVAVAAAQMAKLLGFFVHVIDDRPEFANAERFPQADHIVCQDIAEALSQPFGVNAYYVIVTRGHKDDERALEIILQKSSKYIGMIGSKAKVALTMDRLRGKSYDESCLRRVHAPIGLKIGAITPAEIAVSIMAEIIMVLNESGRDKFQADILKTAAAEKKSWTMVTILEKQGSTPRGAGSKMLVASDGTVLGTIGGGAIEFQAAQRAVLLAGTGKAEVREYDLSLQDASGLGMVCGGRVKVLLEGSGW